MCEHNSGVWGYVVEILHATTCTLLADTLIRTCDVNGPNGWVMNPFDGSLASRPKPTSVGRIYSNFRLGKANSPNLYICVWAWLLHHRNSGLSFLSPCDAATISQNKHISHLIRREYLQIESLEDLLYVE